MDKKTLAEVAGFTTWLEFYEFLNTHGRDGKMFSEMEFIKITLRPHVGGVVYAENEAPKEPVTWTVLIREVKALAFDEIYPNLPTAEVLERIKGFYFEMGTDWGKMLNIPVRK